MPWHSVPDTGNTVPKLDVRPGPDPLEQMVARALCLSSESVMEGLGSALPGLFFPPPTDVTWSLPGELRLISVWHKKSSLSWGLQCLPLPGLPNKRRGLWLSQNRYSWDSSLRECKEPLSQEGSIVGTAPPAGCQVGAGQWSRANGHLPSLSIALIVLSGGTEHLVKWD